MSAMMEATVAQNLGLQLLRQRPKVPQGFDTWAVGVSLPKMANFGQNPCVSALGSYDSNLGRVLPGTVSASHMGTSVAGDTILFDAFASQPACLSAFSVLTHKCLAVGVRERCTLSQVRIAPEEFLTRGAAPSAVTREEAAVAVNSFSSAIWEEASETLFYLSLLTLKYETQTP